MKQLGWALKALVAREYVDRGECSPLKTLLASSKSHLLARRTGIASRPRCAMLVGLVLFLTLPAHAMQAVGKSAGPTTPFLPDFSPAYANHTGHVGYGNATPHRMLIETFPVRCAAHASGVNSATFSITLRKLSSTVGDAGWTRLIFWDRGVQHFNTRIWSPHEPVGSVKTLNFNIAALPPSGGMVHANDGHGLNLLRDRDFSFSVNDDAGVVQAKLTYQCAGHTVAQGHIGVASTYAPLVPNVSVPTPHQPPVDRFGRITYSTNFGTPADTPCPHLNSAYGRGMIGSQLIMRRIAPNADTVCARRGAPNGFSQIVFTSCAMDARGPSYGLITRATVTCNS